MANWESPSSGHPLRLIDASLIGGPIDQMLQVPLTGHGEFTPTRLFGGRDLDAARRHRITPLVRKDWVEPHLRDQLGVAQRRIAVTQLRLEYELGVILGILELEEVDCRVLKGMATAALDYPNPGLRHSGDIDLLVRAKDVERVVGVMTGRGATKYGLSQDADLDLTKGITFVTQGGIEIDVHTRLTHYVQQDIEDLMRDPDALPGLPGSALPADLRLLHAAGHLIWSPFGTRRLSGLVDVSVLLDSGVRAGNLAERAAQLGMSGFAGAGLAIEHQLRGRDSAYLEGWDRLHGLEDVAFGHDRRSIAREHLLALWRTGAWSSRGRYLRQFLLPGTSYLQRRGGASAYYGKLLSGTRWRR